MDDFHEYVSGIAEARYVIRKVFRIIDEQARRSGLDPLEHQALIQIYGSPAQTLQVNSLSDRLDIAAAFASRIVRHLEEKGFVSKRSSEVDRRVTQIHMEDAGRELVQTLNRSVHTHVEYFQSQLDLDVKVTALSIFAFYVGLDLDPDDIKGLFSSRSSSEQ
jgi:DNA-binding MarR family transcriptional regulator